MTHRMETFLSDATIEALCRMSEKELQAKIVEPLLRKKGFVQVRDTSGGPSEKGKDLTAIMMEFRKPMLYAIQIKKWKISAKIANPKSMMRVIDQLNQMMAEDALDPTNNTHRPPNRGIFITPYPITHNAWKSAINSINELERTGIQIIDGITLAEEVLFNIPERILASDSELQYRLQVSSESDKIRESTALAVPGVLSLDSLYVDLSVEYPWTHLALISKKKPNYPGQVTIHARGGELAKLTRYYYQWTNKMPGPWISIQAMSDQIAPINKLRSTIETDIVTAKVNLDPVIKVAKSRIKQFIEKLSNATRGNINTKRLNDVISDGIDITHRLNSLGTLKIIQDYWPVLEKDRTLIESSRRVTGFPGTVLEFINHPLLITGGAGIGKTTLLRRLSQIIARKSTNYLPILVYLLKIKNPTEDAIIKECRSELRNLGYTLESKRFISGLKSGKYKLLFDGLDETGAISIDLFKAIKNISATYRKSPIVVSCRDSYPLPSWERALSLHMIPFNCIQLDDFVQKWFRAEPSSYAKITSWLRDNPQMLNAARTPLIAALLCSLYDSDTDLPTTQVELYERRFGLLLGEWEKAKGLWILPKQLQKIYWHFLMKLAYRLHEEQIRLIDYKSVTAIAASYFEKKFHKTPDGLVQDCIRRGLLLLDQQMHLSFGHFTYQEYMVGRWLASQNPVETLYDKIGDLWWKNTIEFYASIKEDISSLLTVGVDAIHNDGHQSESKLKIMCKLIQFAPVTDNDVLRTAKTLLRRSSDHTNSPVY